jgi:hypothetical protein
MTQKPSNSSQSRNPGRRAGDDLDALLDSIIGEDSSVRQERAAQPAREANWQRQEQPRVQEQVRVEERPRQIEIMTDELRDQLNAIALQVRSLSTAVETQAEQGHAIQELRQAVREIVVANKQPKTPPPMFNAEIQLPSLQIKLVLAQAANILHQADKDVTVLGSWSMLFTGVALGTLFGFALVAPFSSHFWISLVIALFAVLVALIFGFLTFQARRRVARARKAMEESTLTRTVPINN